jgi:hypothetical protein
MPTFTHGKDAVFKVTDAGSTLRDISDVLNTASLSREVETAEVTTLGDDDKAYIPGLRDGTVSVEGMADVTTSGYIDGLLGTTTTFEFYPAGTGTGQVKYAGSCILTSVETGAELGGAVTMSGEFQITGGITRTVVGS